MKVIWTIRMIEKLHTFDMRMQSIRNLTENGTFCTVFQITGLCGKRLFWFHFLEFILSVACMYSFNNLLGNIFNVLCQTLTFLFVK
jgi:hypothetical protein